MPHELVSEELQQNVHHSPSVIIHRCFGSMATIIDSQKFQTRLLLLLLKTIDWETTLQL